MISDVIVILANAVVLAICLWLASRSTVRVVENALADLAQELRKP